MPRSADSRADRDLTARLAARPAKRCSAAGTSPRALSPSAGSHTDVVHYIVALGLGVEEVGAEAFAEAIAATGLYPQLSAQQWRDAMIEAYACGTCAGAFAALTRFDPAAALENADIERLRQRREVAIGAAAARGRKRRARSGGLQGDLALLHPRAGRAGTNLACACWGARRARSGLGVDRGAARSAQECFWGCQSRSGNWTP